MPSAQTVLSPRAGRGGRSDPEGRPRRLEALAWTVAVSVLWIVVYAGCNWVSGLRSDVRTVRFAWERHIPLIPWLIVPYMSIDLFFVSAPFLCTSRREMNALLRRLAAATLLAGLVFLMVPLTLEGQRLTFAGWAGAIHDFLKAGDRPYNLCPSLHAAFALLLWPVYHRHTRGLLRAGVHVWFALMMLSILPVYQHHFIDIVGGVVLALVCFAVFPEAAPGSTPIVGQRRWRVAGRYALLSAPFLGLAVWLGVWGWVLAWIGAALVLVSLAYVFADAGVFQKRDGRIGAGARVFLCPYLAGLHVSRRYYFRRMGPAWCRVGERLIVGRVLDEEEARGLMEAGVRGVVDLTAEHDEAGTLLRGPYLNLAVLDLTAPSVEHCRRAAEFVTAQAGPVYMHCGLGLSRSATVAATCLIALREAVTADEACAMVERARAGVRLGRVERGVVGEFAEELGRQSLQTGLSDVAGARAQTG